MDPSLSDFTDYTNGYSTIDNDSFWVPTQVHPLSPDFGLAIDDNIFSPSPPLNSDWDSPPLANLSPDGEFSETAKYISQILMEETIEEKPSMFYDPLGLQVTEKSFYDALGETYPHTSSKSPSPSTSDSGDSNSFPFPKKGLPSPSDSGDSNPFPYPKKGLPSVDELLAHNIFGDTDSVSQFRRGVEEANKFLPKTAQLSFEADPKPRKSHREREENEDGSDGENIRRSNKQSAVYSGEAEEEEKEEIAEMFDKVLLNADHSSCKDPPENKITRRQQRKKKETVDLRTLLMLCAQAVSASDTRNATELLKQIRKHSSHLGDGSQRLSHYFANALEARLAGTGAGMKLSYANLLSKSRASDILKAYQLNLATTPFKKMSMFFANKSIMKAAEGAAALHIVDFGIVYGFQWPILIKHLAGREGGPPRLRITAVEYPQKGFRPAERVEETGRRLEKYCRRFGVPFEYCAVPSEHWHTIRPSDISVRPGEVLAVNTLMRFKNLPDESSSATSPSWHHKEEKCPRDTVLGLIRSLKPAVFVKSIVSGGYNAPFFVTRFREAVFHYSALFDALECTIPRGNEEREMYEREFYGREAINVVACEGPDRVERPETYKQWHVRTTRAGFRPLPLDPHLLALFRDKLAAWYHKDFAIDHDNHWMLQGWKGRIVYASSCWVPN